LSQLVSVRGKTVNVILFISDTFRFDNLSCYTQTKAKTPALDRFAREAFVFDNACLGSFPTVPNRLDLMSGRFSFIDHEWCPLPQDTVTLQQVLSASGVITQLIADNPHTFEMGFNYDRGFDGFEWIRGQESDHWKTAPKNLRLPTNADKIRGLDTVVEVFLRNTAWWKSEADRFVARTVQTACQWLEENQDQDQFYLCIDTFDPHEPWDAPQNYVDLYDTAYRGDPIFYPHVGFWREFFTQEEMDHIRALYMAEVSMVDHWFGVLLGKIDELGLAEDTAVIFTSDHGYLFGEHDLTGKNLQPETAETMFYETIPMYEDIRRVPLLIRLPGQAQGQHLGALVQSPDLMPTILEMAGLVATESMGGRSRTKALQCGVFATKDWEFNPEAIHGKSLMPLLRGETERHRDLLVCSNTLIHHTPIIAKCAIVTDDGWCLHYAGNYEQAKEASSSLWWLLKLIDPEHARISPDPALYYLPEDPAESNNVIDKNRALAREIHERYVRWLEEAGTPQSHVAGRRKLW
jgi:arylsulfatase A-like enzyme